MKQVLGTMSPKKSRYKIIIKSTVHPAANLYSGPFSFKLDQALKKFRLGRRVLSKREGVTLYLLSLYLVIDIVLIITFSGEGGKSMSLWHNSYIPAFPLHHVKNTGI